MPDQPEAVPQARGGLPEERGASPEALGLIAGDGRLPAEIARAARSAGRLVAAVAFKGISDPGLEAAVHRIAWLHLGELEAALDFLKAAGAREVVLAGKVAKGPLLGAGGELRLDARARALLGGLADRRDDTILAAIADWLDTEGIRVAPQIELVPELTVSEGVLGRVIPTQSQWQDLCFAWPIAKTLGGLDIGQTVVVQDRAVLAVEAIEGTDAAVDRGGKLGGPGLCIVKVAKPDQDPRFDLPTIGLGTLARAASARASLLAFEAGGAIVLDRDALVERADDAGIALVAVSPSGPGSSGPAKSPPSVGGGHDERALD